MKQKEDDFILAHRSENVARLAFSLSGNKELDAGRVLRQVEGWQRLRRKVPSWAAVDGLEYPVRLSLEQCSGEAAAIYKSGIVRRLCPAGGVMADLTGGLGVDFVSLAPHFERALYIERNEELCRLAHHNFPLLGLRNHEIIEGDGVERLAHLDRLSFVMLDPARRDAAGRKTVLLEDCEPNVIELLPLLQEKARLVLVKLSPMLDLGRALADLPMVAEVHVVAEGGECKELLLVLRQDAACPTIYCVDNGKSFSFTFDEERSASVEYTDEIEGFLCEPNAAVLKAGGFKSIALRYGLKKLHPNTHLYISPRFIEDFPGRVLRIERHFGFSKKELRHLSDVQQANLTVRNFPASVAELRRKLKLREGGEVYLFAATTASGKHIIVDCRRESPTEQ